MTEDLSAPGTWTKCDDPRVLAYVRKAYEDAPRIGEMLDGRLRWHADDVLGDFDQWCRWQGIGLQYDWGVVSLVADLPPPDPLDEAEAQRIVEREGLADLPLLFLRISPNPVALVPTTDPRFTVPIYRGDVYGVVRELIVGNLNGHGKMHRGAYIVGRRDVRTTRLFPDMVDIEGERVRVERRYLHGPGRPIHNRRYVQVSDTVRASRVAARVVAEWLPGYEEYLRHDAERRAQTLREERSAKAIAAMEDDEGLVAFGLD